MGVCEIVTAVTTTTTTDDDVSINEYLIAVDIIVELITSRIYLKGISLKKELCISTWDEVILILTSSALIDCVA